MGEKFDGKVFVAFMFLGLGIGIIFGQAGAGIIIGMGLGFIAGTLVRIEPGSVVLKVPSVALGIIMGILGMAFIISGLGPLIGLEIPWEVIGGFALIAIGIAMLMSGFKVVVKR